MQIIITISLGNGLQYKDYAFVIYLSVWCFVGVFFYDSLFIVLYVFFFCLHVAAPLGRSLLTKYIYKG